MVITLLQIYVRTMEVMSVEESQADGKWSWYMKTLTYLEISSLPLLMVMQVLNLVKVLIFL